jgi:hypothetical protein
MKPKNNLLKLLLAFCLLIVSVNIVAQDSVKKELLVDIEYYLPANKLPYILVHTKTKVEKRFLPVKDIKIAVFMDSDSAAHSLGNSVTDENGTAKFMIPSSMKTVWESSATHSFIASTGATKEFDETRNEINVTKSKIEIDTVAGAESRTIQVSVFSLSEGNWIPARDVEMKIGVRRAGGLLPVGEEETYTTDSTGTVQAEFKRENLPGDTKGNLSIVVKVEGNEMLGNLESEKMLTWGAPRQPVSSNHPRTLWSTRDKAPIWLLFMAISIMAGVWGTIVYLIATIIRIKKLGKQAG